MQSEPTTNLHNIQYYNQCLCLKTTCTYVRVPVRYPNRHHSCPAGGRHISLDLCLSSLRGGRIWRRRRGWLRWATWARMVVWGCSRFRLKILFFEKTQKSLSSYHTILHALNLFVAITSQKWDTIDFSWNCNWIVCIRTPPPPTYVQIPLEISAKPFNRFFIYKGMDVPSRYFVASLLAGREQFFGPQVFGANDAIVYFNWTVMHYEWSRHHEGMWVREGMGLHSVW